jgi:hypothetical protein
MFGACRGAPSSTRDPRADPEVRVDLTSTDRVVASAQRARDTCCLRRATPLRDGGIYPRPRAPLRPAQRPTGSTPPLASPPENPPISPDCPLEWPPLPASGAPQGKIRVLRASHAPRFPMNHASAAGSATDLRKPARRRPDLAQQGRAAHRGWRSQDSSSFNRAPQEHL